MIFRDALVHHYLNGLEVGEEVGRWLKKHGGWLPDPQAVYGDGTPPTRPVDEGEDVTSLYPVSAMKEAEQLMHKLDHTTPEEAPFVIAVNQWLIDAGRESNFLTPLISVYKERVAFHEGIITAKELEIARQDAQIRDLRHTIAVKDDVIRSADRMIALLRSGVEPRTTERSGDRSRSPLRFGDSD